MWLLHAIISPIVVRYYTRLIRERRNDSSRLMRLLSRLEFKTRHFKPTKVELFLWYGYRYTKTFEYISQWLDCHFQIWLDSPDGNSGRTLIWYPAGRRSFEHQYKLARWRKPARLEKFFDFFACYPEW